MTGDTPRWRDLDAVLPPELCERIEAAAEAAQPILDAIAAFAKAGHHLTVAEAEEIHQALPGDVLDIIYGLTKAGDLYQAVFEMTEAVTAINIGDTWTLARHDFCAYPEFPPEEALEHLAVIEKRRALSL